MFTDEFLVREAQSGKAESVSELVVRYTPLITALAAKMQGSVELEDLVQEGMIGFLDAISHFKEGQGSQFRTYASVCVKNRLRNALRRSSRGKHRILSGALSLEDVGEIPQSDQDPQELLVRLEEQHSKKDQWEKLLTDRERNVLIGYLQGLSYEEIAERQSLTPKAVDNALQRAKRKLRPGD